MSRMAILLLPVLLAAWPLTAVATTTGAADGPAVVGDNAGPSHSTDPAASPSGADRRGGAANLPVFQFAPPPPLGASIPQGGRGVVGVAERLAVTAVRISDPRRPVRWWINQGRLTLSFKVGGR